jgi:hypothetical protein
LYLRYAQLAVNRLLRNTIHWVLKEKNTLVTAQVF